ICSSGLFSEFNTLFVVLQVLWRFWRSSLRFCRCPGDPVQRNPPTCWTWRCSPAVRWPSPAPTSASGSTTGRVSVLWGSFWVTLVRSVAGSVRLWDVRHRGSDAVQTFGSDSTHSFCSFDLNCSDALLCAGTEQVDGEDSFLVFWDRRKPGTDPLGVYSESHSDDITQVRFHPQDKDRLASGSTDGLVNVFDLSRGAEDEALLATLNSDSSAGAVCWCGPASSRLLCLSHDEGLHLWDLSRLDGDQPLSLFSTADARSLELLPGGGGVDYLVGGSYLEGAELLLVVGGTRSGELHLMSCDGDGLRLLRSLEGGHKSTVRCFLWDAQGEALVTGGEDAQLLLWKPGGEELTTGKKETMKSQSALRLKSRPHKKHEYQRKKKIQKEEDSGSFRSHERV
uniref:WD repeat-containing protein 89 n=2 Tax=Acanthochromis polyacanthus TaxID=80966 RepID=A0A3Q1F7J7_9TELE